MPTFTLNDLARILREAAGVADSVDLDADILDIEFEELGYESIAMLETSSRIEREYRVVIDDEALTTALTPRALINLVNEYLHAHAELTMTGRELHSVEHDIVVNTKCGAE